jgi:hypothetical protein
MYRSGISSVKNAVPVSWVAAQSAIWHASAVFPIEGRAPITIIWPGRNPPPTSIRLNPAHGLSTPSLFIRVEERSDAASPIHYVHRSAKTRRTSLGVPRRVDALGPVRNIRSRVTSCETILDHGSCGEDTAAQRRFVFDDADITVEIDDLRQPDSTASTT